MMEPRYLLDTNTFIYIRRERPATVMRAFQRLKPGEAAVSVITLGELLYGVAKSSQREAGVLQLQRIVEFVPVLPLPEAAASVYGTMRAELESRGQIIGNNDLWIASHAKAGGLTLVTNNEREFRRVRGLKVENWAR